jgi:hypothetical protein
MADWWIGLTNNGSGDGSSFANRQEGTTANIQAALDQLVAGNKLSQEEGTYVISAKLDIDIASGTATSPIYWVGVNTSGIEDGSRFVINANSTAVNGINLAKTYWQIKHVEVINATGDGISWATNLTWSLLYNFSIRNCGGDGIDCNLTNTYGNFVSGEIGGCSGIGVRYPGISIFSNLLIRNNGSHGILEFYYPGVVRNSIIHNNVGSGVHSSKFVSCCVLDGNGVGLTNGANESHYVYENNRITNNTTGITKSGGTILTRNCFFYGNTTKIDAGEGLYLDLGDSIDGASDGYANRAGDDFTISGDGVGVAIQVGPLDETTNIAYHTQGIPPVFPPDAMTVTDISPATGASGATITITGTNFTGSGNIVKLGGSGGTSCTITSESTTSIEFTVPAIATGTYDVYVENSDGSDIVVPNGFILTSAVVPVFAGITHFEILSNNKFYIKTGTATESPIYLVYYISTTTNPFAGAYSFKLAYSANKELVIGEESGHFAPLVAGTRYYCGVRAENANGEDTNTAELSNLCSGTAMIQRQTITVLSAK